MPILIGEHIKINYYKDIYNYFYIDKINIKNNNKYINNIKDLYEKN